ncbi:bifunctional aspartate kinase/homoserine dehydrogenase II [Thalassotalea sp. LPB0316]|uniref:bifunctional aspartate kinase/homoserine dehydrogenase II n=1 Tax=Thalassotalea sp. LPB0316 TaxID=2769490 RepID=UPI001868C420|nr:bifunctional aspartate kinase/homoserine dehydrogenase II [Thalassotalea sp. LPB0316]QOL26543.1 bifunctional aspartate kinase/homoserine dehydrogenase II [Thalassotalea sp. LPB0316]
MTIENLIKHPDSATGKLAINIHKFGGSSLASSECIERVIDIICRHCQINDIVVVSANGGVTDQLFNLCQLAKDNENYQDALENLHFQLKGLIAQLLNEQNSTYLTKQLADDFALLDSWLAKALEKHRNDILAFGEIWSARLLSAVLNERICPSHAVDARDFIEVVSEQNTQVNYDVSRAKFNQIKQDHQLTIATGYIARDVDGRSCTLGRNGSDYSATIMAALTGAANVTLWTDVDGIYSADPRIVPAARKLHRLPNGVARELGRLGNPVLHVNTLKPLEEHATHLHVASSFDSETSGTEIGKFGFLAKQELSVTYSNDVLIVSSELLSSLSHADAIKRFDPICFDESKALMVIKQEQQKTVSQWCASKVGEVTFKPAAIIAVVGHKVASRGDVKARFKRALENTKTLDILSSTSEHSIICVLPDFCSPELTNLVHHEMTKDAKHIGVIVAGLGNIGKRFLEILPGQIKRQSVLENIHLVGLLSSKKALINTDGISPKQALIQFDKQAKDYDEALLLSWLKHHPYDELIVVDITPSETFSLLYREFFKEGIHVIGANKWAASSSTEYYNGLTALAEQNGSIWLGNTTVGAGLPINFAINDLRRSGDEIHAISGIFSGTLSWLFEQYDGSQPFSNLLKSALERGLTEPDPREDLSGRDVQRKLLILARLAGFTLSLEEIACQSLVPDELAQLTTQEFLAQADALDASFAEQLSKAKAQGKCLRYVAEFSAKDNQITAQVGLVFIDCDDAFANLNPCDNIFKVESQWYQSNPLIIQGPGAGRDVTAGGIHSDLVAICEQLSTKQHQVKIKGINE